MNFWVVVGMLALVEWTVRRVRRWRREQVEQLPLIDQKRLAWGPKKGRSQ
jgi:hypothetical protein